MRKMQAASFVQIFLSFRAVLDRRLGFAGFFLAGFLRWLAFRGARAFFRVPFSILVEWYNGLVTDQRYSRQILFQGIGVEGQQRIRKSIVTVVGCGALGTVNSEMLARAGVGSLRLIDRDFVEESNLQRQSLFTEQHARDRIPKAVATRQALQAINSDVDVVQFVDDLTHSNIAGLCSGSDVIVDGTDNFETRYLINDFSIRESVPWVYGGCAGSYGIGYAVVPGKTACLVCLMGDSPQSGRGETCDTVGILAPVVHAVASFQVMQTLKILSGAPLSLRMLRVDLWEDSWSTFSIGDARNPRCRCCGERDFRFLDGADGDRPMRLCGRNAVQITPVHSSSVDFDSLEKRLAGVGKVASNPYVLSVRIEGYEINLFPDGRAIVKGTDEPSVARSVYARYIGK